MKRLVALLLLAATPARAGWDDIHVILYADTTPAGLAALPDLGIDGVRVFGFRTPFTQADVDARIAAPAAAGLRWYVENIATDFYAAYHRWTPEHPKDVNWEFLAVQERHQADPADPRVFIRHPGLWDPVWRRRIADRLAATVRAHRAHAPFYYSLADEPGIADLAAAWDFDLAPANLALFRGWLRGRYASLGALNAEWGSGYTRWDDVVPQGTTAAMARRDDNFAAWNDFKQFMDEQFAEALRAGTDAVHAADPSALAAIEGGQVPGWGGWNYATLAHSVDAMEIYESGRNLDIVRSLNPALVTLSTKFGQDAAQRRQIWHRVLRGTAGFIIWDTTDGTVRPDGTAGPAGTAMAPLWRELRGGLGALLLASPEAPDPVAILYSPASFRLQWLLDHRKDGDAWTRRSSELENQPNAVRTALGAAADALARRGVVPRYLAEGSLAAGLSAADRPRVLILPRALALSDADAQAIAAFARAGGRVLADGEPGVFDGHLRRRLAPALPGLATPLSEDSLAAALADVPGRILLSPPPQDPPTLTRRRNGEVVILGIQPGGGPRPEVLTLADPPAMAWRDLRGSEPWHAPSAGPITLGLDPEAPTLIAFAPAPPADSAIAGPATARAGDTVALTVTPRAPGPAAVTVIHFAVTDPDGRARPRQARTLRLGDRPGEVIIPFAATDKPGTWTITAYDPLTGTRTRHTLLLRPAG